MDCPAKESKESKPKRGAGKKPAAKKAPAKAGTTRKKK